MDPYTRGLLAAAPGVVKGLSKLFRPAPQQKVSSDTTALLNKQRQIGKEGLYGQDVKNEIFTDIKQTQKEGRQNIANLAIKQGLENSGIPAEQMLKQGGRTTLEIAKIAKQIAQANEESKLKGLEEAARIGQGIENIDYNNALARLQRGDSITDDFFDAATTGIGDYFDQARTSALDEYLFGTSDKDEKGIKPEEKTKMAKEKKANLLDWIINNFDILTR
jgi:hypothetical protein|tara:strand:+ start:1339 stop:1998 length:660 start_codon:yes stop_codon:yes gene_type:complete